MKTLCVLSCLASAGLGLPARAQGPGLADLLHAAAAYLTGYERQISLVVSEESYTQVSRGSGLAVLESRVLKSDVLVINGGTAGWFGFRDVYEVDGHAIRDHQDRILDLMTSPSPDPLAQAKRMADEGARYNIGGIVRTINMPTFALVFLRGAEQGRSTWTRGGTGRINGRPVVELRFAEQVTPRLITSKDAAAAGGRFWVEPDSGRVVRSELRLESMGISANVTVTYGADPKLEPWVPLSMDESYRWTLIRPAGTVDGHATYKNFRTFSVSANTIIK